MQSWGVQSRWDIRDTGEEPSKSGIIGMIGCALGYPMYDPRLKKLDEQLRMGVRINRSGKILTDFHTVTGKLPKADQTRQLEERTIVSRRSYLLDASFLVVLEGPKLLVSEIAHAFSNPMWPIYLGRKSCPPTRPVFDCVKDEYDSLEEVLRRYDLPPSESSVSPNSKFKCIIEDKNGTAIRPDRLLNSPVRMYGNRNIRIEYIGCE